MIILADKIFFSERFCCFKKLKIFSDGLMSKNNALCFAIAEEESAAPEP